VPANQHDKFNNSVVVILTLRMVLFLQLDNEVYEREVQCTEKILKRRKPTDKRITRIESVKITL